MLAAELRRDRVLVNAVCPGWVATDMGGAGGRPVAAGAASVVWAANCLTPAPPAVSSVTAGRSAGEHPAGEPGCLALARRRFRMAAMISLGHRVGVVERQEVRPTGTVVGWRAGTPR